MASSIQRRRGTTSDHSTFTGAVGEITIDTTKDTVVVHDGAVVGGVPLLREDGSNSSLALGSQGVPSLKFSGDPNTGIYSPGADQLAVATNGTGRLFVDASGNVGIGTSSPSHQLDVVSAATSVAEFNGPANAAVEFKGSGFVEGKIQCGGEFIIGSTNNYPVAFVANNTERLRITSGGLVGIGTSAPSAQFVVGSGNTLLGHNTLDNYGGRVDIRSAYSARVANGPAQLFVADSAGSQLINTGGAIDLGGYQDQFSRAYSYARIQGLATSSSGLGGYLSFTVLNGGGSLTERVRIDTAGNVGIGTAGPTRLLTLYDAGTLTYLQLAHSGASGASRGLEFVLNSTEANIINREAGGLFLNTAGGPITFGSAGERARIDSSGRLLVGTSTSPSAGDGQYAVISAVGYAGSPTGTGYFAVNHGSAATSLANDSTVANVSFGDNTGKTFARIQCQVDATPGADDYPGRLVFSTTADGASSPTERMRITSGGLVGIGNSSPDQTLSVGSGSADTRMSINGTGQYQLKFTNSGANGFWIGSPGANSLAFAQNDGTTRMTITSAGLVGIGTTSVNAKIQIEGSDAAPAASGNMNSGIVYQAGAGARAVNIGVDNTNNFAWINSAFTNNSGIGANTGLRLMVGATSAIAIDSSQRVGIGTTSPGQTLHVSESGGNNFVGIRSHNSNTGTGTAGIEFSSDSTYAKSAIGLVRGDTNGVGSLVFYNASSTGAANWSTSDERLRIDSSGRLLVGTSSVINNNYGGTAGRLQVAKDDYLPIGFFTYNNTIGETGYCPYLELNRARGTQASPSAVGNGDDLGLINFYGHDGSTFIRSASIKAVVDGGVNTTNDMPGRLVFSTTPDNQSPVTGPVERMRITQWGGLWLGTSTGATGYKFTVEGANSAGVSGGGIEARCAGAGDANFYSVSNTIGYHFYGNGTGVFYVENDGDVRNTNNSYGAISDIKLKENIVDANSQWDDLKALQVRNYNFKEGQTHTQIGLVAQEVELVSPGLVSESPDRDAEGNDLGTVTKSVNYSVLYMKAVKALQEAMERIETLEAKVAALESA